MDMGTRAHVYGENCFKAQVTGTGFSLGRGTCCQHCPPSHSPLGLPPVLTSAPPNPVPLISLLRLCSQRNLLLLIMQLQPFPECERCPGH